MIRSLEESVKKYLLKMKQRYIFTKKMKQVFIEVPNIQKKKKPDIISFSS